MGPFARFGEVTIEAALAAGCHYLDTTGEQNWMLEMQGKFHHKFEQAGLVCAPATAYMFTVSDIAARVCLETPGIDSLELRIFTFGTPTVGSTQSVFDMCRNPSYQIVDHQLLQYEKRCWGTGKFSAHWKRMAMQESMNRRKQANEF